MRFTLLVKINDDYEVRARCKNSADAIALGQRNVDSGLTSQVWLHWNKAGRANGKARCLWSEIGRSPIPANSQS